MPQIDFDDLTYQEPQPTWIVLIANGPAVHLTPLDWVDYELCRRMSVIVGSEVINLRQFYQLLIRRTGADAWKNVLKGGQEMAFSADALLVILCRNAALGLAFDAALRAFAMRQQKQAEADVKNSAAGCDTPVAPPATAAMTATADASA